MNIERKLIVKSLQQILLIAIAIVLPKLMVPDNPLLYQVIAVIFVVVFFAVVQYRVLVNILNNLMSKVGFEQKKGKSMNDMIEDIEDVFDKSEHTATRYIKMNHALKLSIEINNLFLKTNDQQAVYDFILEKALEASGKGLKGSIMLLNQDDELRPISLYGFDESFKELRIHKEDDFLYKMTEGKVDHSVIIKDVVAFNKHVMTATEFEAFYERYPKVFQTVLSTPIKVDNDFIGVINIDSHEEDTFGTEDQFIMDLFASQLEVAIRNRKLLDEILYLSRYDDLTGVYNRRYFDDTLHSLIKQKVGFVYALIDMNKLKKVNDSFGHAEGDKFLKTFCEVVRENIRSSDYFARLGGDEFAIILTESDKMNASKTFLRMMKELNMYTKTHSMPYDIHFSYGLTKYPDDARTAEELYLLSDIKMYKMKRNEITIG